MRIHNQKRKSHLINQCNNEGSNHKPWNLLRCQRISHSCHKVAFFEMFDQVWRCHIAQLAISVDADSCVFEFTDSCPFCDGTCNHFDF